MLEAWWAERHSLRGGSIVQGLNHPDSECLRRVETSFAAFTLGEFWGWVCGRQEEPAGDRGFVWGRRGAVDKETCALAGLRPVPPPPRGKGLRFNPVCPVCWPGA